MKLAPALAVGLATVGASLLVAAPTAAAQPGTCAVTFQPFDGRSYAAAAVVDGQVQNIITRQSGVLDNGPVTVTYTAPSGIDGDPTGVTEVWWAARNPARQDTAADFYDVLHVRPDCTFVETYHAIPGKQDSVVIRKDRIPTPTLPIETTTSAAPTTTLNPTTTIQVDTTQPTPQTTFATTPLPSTTTTEQPPTGTTSSTVSIPTTTIEVDEPLQPEPTTTAPAPPPEVPVPSTTSTTSQVELFTATSVEQTTGTLPMTGINSLTRFIWGVGFMAAGLILAIGGRACRRLQRARVQS